MRITNIKVNGITNPIGYAITCPIVSWLVVDTDATSQQYAQIVVSSDNKTVYRCDSQQCSVDSIGTMLNFQLQHNTRYDIDINVIADNGDSASGHGYFVTALPQEQWQSQWITCEDSSVRPIFGKQFDIQKNIVSASLLITALGAYCVSLNEQSVSDELLTPYFSDYNSEVQYQTYDLMPFINHDNTITVTVGNGWYGSRFGINNHDNAYGNMYALRAEIHLVYEDGSSDKVLTDSSWSCAESNIICDQLYDGETYDGTKDIVFEHRCVTIDKPLDIVPRTSQPVKRMTSLTVKEIITTPKGETVLDFGQNHTGIIEFVNDCNKGEIVTLRFGEILQEGNFFCDNYRTAKATFTCISSGRSEVVTQRFTFCGYRYVKVEGFAHPIDKNKFVSHAISTDLEVCGNIHTGNQQINRLINNVIWSQISNFVDIPTDCPQRDERLGWTGDAQVFCNTASYLCDTRAFFDRYLLLLRQEQTRYCNGAIPNYIPSKGDTSSCCVWGDCCAIIPDMLVKHYGDCYYKPSYYDSIKQWIDYLVQSNGVGLIEHGFQFGDWLALDGITPCSMKGGTDDVYVASMYFLHTIDIARQFATKLGLAQDVLLLDNYYDRVHGKIINRYYTPDGRLSVDTQTAYILALAFDVYIDADIIIQQYKDRLLRDCYVLKTGFVGTSLLMNALSKHNLHQLAFDFLCNDNYPGWLYCVKMGATTIWERWNSMLPDGSCSGVDMNSFNHYSYGSVLELLYTQVFGITPLDNGFCNVRIAPHLDWRLGDCNCSYLSVAGQYNCSWVVANDGDLIFDITVPFNCKATIELPYSDKIVQVTAGKYHYRYRPNIDIAAPYGADTRLALLKGNQQAMEVMAKYIPQAVGIIESDNKDFVNYTVGQLKSLFFMGITPAAVDQAIQQLSKIRIIQDKEII